MADFEWGGTAEPVTESSSRLFLPVALKVDGVYGGRFMWTSTGFVWQPTPDGIWKQAVESGWAVGATSTVDFIEQMTAREIDGTPKYSKLAPWPLLVPKP
jgi:hypothetical protein